MAAVETGPGQCRERNNGSGGDRTRAGQDRARQRHGQRQRQDRDRGRGRPGQGRAGQESTGVSTAWLDEGYHELQEQAEGRAERTTGQVR